MRTVAALFVDRRGPYFSMPGVEPWDEERDATRYAGPHPVVAHPPCARWSMLNHAHKHKPGRGFGQDGGVFESALASVRRWGGVLEHPAETQAFRAFGIPEPVRGGGWQMTLAGEWVCQIPQCAYGHVARKLTWLLLVGGQPPMETRWRGSWTNACSGVRNGTVKPEMKKTERHLTPRRFADFLVALARSVKK